MLADTAAVTSFILAPLPLVLADIATATFYALAPLPLMIADAAAATLFTLAPLPLMLADAAAATFYARTPQSLVLAPAVSGCHHLPAALLSILPEDLFAGRAVDQEITLVCIRRLTLNDTQKCFLNDI